MHKPMTNRLNINLYIDNYKTKGKQMKYIHTLSRIKYKKKTRKKRKIINSTKNKSVIFLEYINQVRKLYIYIETKTFGFYRKSKA